MAALRAVLLALVCACDSLHGFGGPVPPLATFTVTVTANGALQPMPSDGGANLSVALVWGRQWLIEPLCLEGLGNVIPFDPRDDPMAVKLLLQAGCRDPFGFVPGLVAVSTPLQLGTPVTFDLEALPGADVMVGDVTARVAYGSFVVYDDRNQNGTLDLARPDRPPDNGRPNPPGDLPTVTIDATYGASLLAMTIPDQRVSYREGAFVPSAFYPRAGCGDPPTGFAIEAASGFGIDAAVQATLAGGLPAESDPTACAQQPASTPVTIALPPPEPPNIAAATDVRELACSERTTDSTVRYREPPVDPIDMTFHTWACVHHPSFGTPSDVVELVISGSEFDSCLGLTHYILKGCREGPDCGTPDWDHSVIRPTWWPCP